MKLFSWLRHETETLDSLTIAYDRHRGRVRLTVHGSHTLVIGLTGSGKGSAIASIVAALCRCSEPFELYFIDLKMGSEAAFYSSVTTESAYTPEAVETLLSSLLEKVRNRAVRMRGTTRDLQPCAEFPQLVLVIDEAAELGIGYDTEGKKRSAHILQLLDELLRLGRAWGFSCIACTQDPRIESFKLRARFPQRICLRVNDETEARMCLTDRAVDLGASPQTIPPDAQGTAWLFDAECGVPQLFRFHYYTDADILGFRCRGA